MWFTLVGNSYLLDLVPTRNHQSNMVQNAVFVIVLTEDIIQLLSGQHSNDDMIIALQMCGAQV